MPRSLGDIDNFPIVSALPAVGELGQVVTLASTGKLHYWDTGLGAWQQVGAGSSVLDAPTIPTCRLLKSAQTLTTGSLATLAWDIEEIDTDSMHDTVTNNSRITVKTPGVYLFEANIAFVANATGVRNAYLAKNGQRAGSGTSSLEGPAAPASSYTQASLVTIAYMNAGDYMEVWASQGSGGNLDVLASSDVFAETHFTATWLGEGRGVVGAQSVPAARVYPSANVNVPNSAGVWQAIAFDSEIFDTDNMHDTVTNNSRVVCKTPGTYVITATGYLNNGANPNGTYRLFALRKNGTTWIADGDGVEQNGGFANASIRGSVATVVQLNAGDYVEFMVYQDSGATITLQGGVESTNLSVAMIGAAPRAVIPHVRVRKSSNAWPAASTSFFWDVEDIDNDGMHDLVTNTNRLTCQTPGVYIVVANIVAVAPTSNQSFIIRKNGVNTAYISKVNDALYEDNPAVAIMEMAAGDWVDLYSQTSPGGTMNNAVSSLSMVKIGLSGQSGVAGGTQWAANGTDIQPTNSGQVRFPNGIYTEPWHNVGGSGEPAFQNSWVQYGDPTYAQTAFCKDAAGIVHLKGLMSSGAANLTIFNLPVGYRPSRQPIFPVLTSSGLSRIDIFANGDIRVGVSGAGGWVSLDGISFRAEA